MIPRIPSVDPPNGSHAADSERPSSPVPTGNSSWRPSSQINSPGDPAGIRAVSVRYDCVPASNSLTHFLPAVLPLPGPE